MKRLLCLLLLVASSTEAAYHVKAWKPAGESRFILQCIADAVIDLPTCASVSDGFDCRVLATNELYLCDGATWSAVGGSPGGISDGDKGDITVSSSGAVWSVDPNSVDLGTDTVGGYAGSATEGGVATSAADLVCTACIGGTEIDESSLGTVATATSATTAGSATTAATATALAADPTACGAGDFVTDIAADGTLTCATPSGGSGLTHPQVMARLAIGGGY